MQLSSLGSPKHQGAYRPEIDGLRAIAVLTVIFYHANNPIFTGGYVGVDVFFVISGFLITSIIDREFSQGRFTFRAFYERRIRRILPALYFVLISVTLLGFFALTPPELRNLGQSIVGTVAFSANIFFYFKSGYFDPAAESHPLLHMWSLGVEEQFYIAFPVVLLLFWRLVPRLRVPAIIGALLASFIFSVVRIDSHPSDAFFLPHLRAWELLTGCLVALMLRPQVVDEVTPQWAVAAIEIFALACVCVPVVVYDSSTLFPGWAAVPPVVGTALLIIFSRPQSLVGRMLSSRPFVMVGLISYSAYLWHQPILVLARIRSGGELTPLLAYGLAAASLVMAYLSWRFVERPFRDRSFLTQKQIFAWAGVSTAALAAIGLLFHVSDGVPQRFSVAAQNVAKSSELSPRRSDCHADADNPIDPSNACRYFAENHDWAVFGDSHGLEFGYALAEFLEPQEKGIVHLTYSGCAPLLRDEVDNPGCTRWVRETTEWLSQQDAITNLVLAFRHTQYLSGPIHPMVGSRAEFHPPFLHDLPADEARAAYWDDLALLISKLDTGSRRIMLLITVPELPRNPYDYVYTGQWPFMSSEQDPKVSLDYILQRQSGVRDELELIAGLSPNVFVLDPNDTLCTGDDCHVVLDGQQLYFDDNHLSLPGARLLVADALSNSSITLGQ